MIFQFYLLPETYVFTKSLDFNKHSFLFFNESNYNTSIIELIDEVIIIRNQEQITGDYGTLDTKNNSYKIKSNNQNKVKVVIQNNE